MKYEKCVDVIVKDFYFGFLCWLFSDEELVKLCRLFDFAVRANAAALSEVDFAKFENSFAAWQVKNAAVIW